MGQNDGMASVNPTGGTPPYSISWSDGQTGTEATNLAPNDYVVTIIDANDCSFSSNFTINSANCDLIASADVMQPNCAGELGTVVITVAGGTPPFTFDMNGSGTYLPGTYNFSGSDAAGCPFSGVFTVVGASEIIATANISNASCPTVADGSISLTINGGTPPYMVDLSLIHI